MEINPYEARLRMLQLQDGVQMQREATPGTDTAGCPGCPYYWTCDVPHRAEDVAAPAEFDREEVADQVPARERYRPRDVEDIGWTDQWVEVDEPADAPDDGTDAPEDGADAPEDGMDAPSAPGSRERRRWRDLLRRR